jgi:hypothetical protein
VYTIVPKLSVSFIPLPLESIIENRKPVKTLKSGSMKDKLAGYVSSFANHKKELHLLLTSQSSLKVNDIQTDVRTILSLIKTKSATEQKADDFINSVGGLDAVIKV